MNVRALAAPGIGAVKDNWRPIVLIQICFVVFVALFYSLPSLQSLPDRISDFRAAVTRPVFVIGSIWLVSILVPEIAKRLTGQKPIPLTWKDVVLRMVYFAVVGMAVDSLYNWMDVAYGASNAAHGLNYSAVVKKILTDQFVFSPLVSMPLAALTFLYQDSGFSASSSMDRLRRGGFWKRFFPLLMTCWMYFGPVTIAMYCLPVGLIFPVAMTANAAWGIIVVAVGTHGGDVPEGGVT